MMCELFPERSSGQVRSWHCHAVAQGSVLVREQDPTNHAVQPKKKKMIMKGLYCLNVKNLIGLLNKEHVKHKD